MTVEHPPVMRDHWWWRPGWTTGRSFYTWHVTFEDQPAIHQLTDAYAHVLTQLPALDPVPVQWLHLTMQGIGFTDEVEQDAIARIVQATHIRCTGLQPFTVTVGPPHTDLETIQMSVVPIEPLRQLRTIIRDAIADVWGQDRVPEPATDWRPHVSLAYSNSSGPAEPVVQALAAQPPLTAKVEVASVSLIDLNRDRKRYEWSDVARVQLGS